MDIDFVVLWVDGNDPAWQAEKAKYQGKTLDDSNSQNRFRDWGLMPYWFRAVARLKMSPTFAILLYAIK